MKQYLISSHSFTGQAKLVYNDGMLVTIDVFSTSMDIAAREWLFKHAPVFETPALAGGYGIKEFSSLLKAGTKIIASDIEISLEDFKREYPYARNSHLLQPIWDKLSNSDKVRAFIGARDYREHCNKNKKWYKPKIAAAWLNDKEYLNDWKTL